MSLRRSKTHLRVVGSIALLLIAMASASYGQTTTSHPKIAILFGASENVSSALIAKTSKPFLDRLSITPIGITAGSTALPQGTDLDSYDLLIVDLSGSMKSFAPQVDQARSHTKVLVIGDPGGPSNVTLSHPDWPQQYWSNLSVENLAAMLRLVEADVLHVQDQPAAPPVLYPEEAFYHPRAPGFFHTLAEYRNWYGSTQAVHDLNRCTVGVLFYFNYYMQLNLAPFDAVLNQIETAGCNAVGLMTKGAPKLDALRLPDGRPYTDVLLYNGERLNLRDFDAGTKEANSLGVPMLGLYLDYRQSRDQYLASTGGLAPGMSGALTDAEQDGIFEPIMVGSRNNPHDPNAAYELMPEQVRWRVERAASWARLRHKTNEEKRVVFTYWSEGGGKADIGGDPDEFLNVPASLARLMQTLKASGYDLGTSPLPDRDQLAQRMSQGAANVGTWEPADLAREVRNKHAILIPEEEYRVWFDRLPEKLRASVVEQWGPPPGNVMVYTAHGRRYLVIPALTYGNILIAPHPDWGYQQSEKALMSAGALPPHHQYLAFFLWLQNSWKADAWVSLFTNITLEPGKSEGPYAEDAVAVLLGNIPHIHPELLGGSGGISNKRKALALTAGWFRGAVSANTDSSYREVREQAQATLSDLSHVAQLRKAMQDAGLASGVHLDIQTASPHELAEAVLQYLDELSHETMPHGSHILGDVPTGETLVQTVLAMLAPDITAGLRQICSTACFERVTRSVVLDGTAPEQAVSQVTGSENAALLRLMQQANEDASRIRQGDHEVGAILDALEGKRLLPGPADDPLLRADALPAGRSLFSFDAAALPTQQAEAEGIQAANATIDAFRKNHGGEYPKKLAFVLWTSELSANGGVTEAEILYLLGVRPVRDARGHITGVALIPRDELSRPRVDVMVTASGLYRDHYKSKIDLIQQAVAVAQNSSEADNPVRSDTELARTELLKTAGSSSQDADKLSAARVFAPAPNAYSPSIQFLAKSGDLRGDEKKMTHLFTSRMDHVYGVGADGDASAAAFASNLSQMQAATLSRSDQVNGLLDNSMPAAFLGGLNMAAKEVNGGHDSELYIDTIRKGSDPKIERASHVIQLELQSKYLNPSWIKAMQASGYDGARYMSEMTDSLSLWSTTAKQSVDSATWESVKQVYVDDRYHLGMQQYFEKNNPYARQVMLTTMLDAANRGFWNASQSEKTHLARELARSIALHGPAGTADVNRNATLSRTVTRAIAGLPGAAALTRSYQRALSQARSQPPAPQLQPKTSRTTPTSAEPSHNLVTGSVLEKVTSSSASTQPRSGLAALAIACILIGALVLVGWIRAGREIAG